MKLSTDQCLKRIYEYSGKSQNTLPSLPPLMTIGGFLDSWADPCSILSSLGKASGVRVPAETGLFTLASFLASLKPPAFHCGLPILHETHWSDPQNDPNAESIPSIITARMKSKLYLVFRRQIENWGFLLGNHRVLSGEISRGAVITPKLQLLAWFSSRLLPFSMNNLPFVCKSSLYETFQQWFIPLALICREINAKRPSTH